MTVCSYCLVFLVMLFRDRNGVGLWYHFLTHRVRTNCTARYKELAVRSPLIATMFENSLRVPLLLRAFIPMGLGQDRARPL